MQEIYRLHVNDGIMTSDRFMMPSLMNEGPFDLTSTSGSVLNLWSKHYAYIAQANLILERLETNKEVIDENAGHSALDKATITGSATEMLMGEVRFLRAYAYFTLYRYYGGVASTGWPRASPSRSWQYSAYWPTSRGISSTPTTSTSCISPTAESWSSLRRPSRGRWSASCGTTPSRRRSSWVTPAPCRSAASSPSSPSASARNCCCRCCAA